MCVFLLCKSNIIPHASCEAWRKNQCWPEGTEKISIHTPHARRDPALVRPSKIIFPISIHTPHARRDTAESSSETCTLYFNPHASCEAWLTGWTCTAPSLTFQSTRLMRGVTNVKSEMVLSNIFQSTRLMRGVTKYTIDTEAMTESISIHTPHARRDFRNNQ